MFQYLKGTLEEIANGFVVIDVNGQGFLIRVANPFHFEGQLHQELKLYVHLAVSDSGLTLYGFSDEENKELYEQLLNVSGIGPKGALAIMAGNDQNGLISAIANGDVAYLTKFPGVGKKTAQQIILDLKEKLKKQNVDEKSEVKTTNQSGSANLEEACQALISLGFTPKAVAKVKKELINLGKELTADQFISEGLKHLTN